MWASPPKYSPHWQRQHDSCIYFSDLFYFYYLIKTLAWPTCNNKSILGSDSKTSSHTNFSVFSFHLAGSHQIPAGTTDEGVILSSPAWLIGIELGLFLAFTEHEIGRLDLDLSHLTEWRKKKERWKERGDWNVWFFCLMFFFVCVWIWWSRNQKFKSLMVIESRCHVLPTSCLFFFPCSSVHPSILNHDKILQKPIHIPIKK